MWLGLFFTAGFLAIMAGCAIRYGWKDDSE
jgi:hypothetical protein